MHILRRSVFLTSLAFLLTAVPAADASAALLHPEHLTRTNLALAVSGLLLFILFETVLVVLLLRFRRGRGELRSEAQKSETAFHAFLDLVPFSCFIQDLDDTFLVINKAFAESIGLPPEKIIGHKASEVGLPAISTAEYDEIGRRLKRDGYLLNQEATRQTPQGTRHIMFSCRFMEFKGRKALFVTSINITERKQMEEELRLRELHFRQLFNLSPVPKESRWRRNFASESFISGSFSTSPLSPW